MKKLLRSQSGMTLAEIIIAMTIFGIIIIGVLMMYQFAVTQIYLSGDRTQSTVDIQTIVEDMNAYNDIAQFSSGSAVSTYLASKGYHPVSTYSEVGTMSGSYTINYYVAPESTKSGVAGYEVTIVQFLQNGKSSVHFTTFVIKGGST